MSKGEDKKNIRSLIELGKSKGYVTYEDVNDYLAEDEVDSGDLDSVFNKLSDERIDVIQQGSDSDTESNDRNGQNSRRAATEETTVVDGERAQAERAEAEASYFSKTNDPVRMYLSKMGSVCLLTREGEVEIAKRIEQGDRQVLDVLLASDIAVQDIIGLGSKLQEDKIRLRDVVDKAQP